MGREGKQRLNQANKNVLVGQPLRTGACVLEEMAFLLLSWYSKSMGEAVGRLNLAVWLYPGPLSDSCVG